MMQSKVVITGGIGSGKSAVGSILRSLGYTVLDADRIAHTVTNEMAEDLATEFGDVLNEDGTLNRNKLGRVVFSSQERVKKLNDMTHPRVYDRIFELAEKTREPVVFVEIPLLFESGMHWIFTNVWLVTASMETRFARVQARSGLSREAFNARVRNQMTDKEKQKLASLVIENDGSLEELEEKVKEAIASIKK